MAALESEVDREQHQQRNDELDPEVIGVARERVRPIDVRSPDRAVDVDLARAPGQRGEDGGVEVPSGRLCDAELQHAVESVEGKASAERRQRPPVEPLATAGDECHGSEEEQEVEQELDHALPPLRQGRGRLEIEEPEQVDSEKREEERERDRRTAREPAVEPLDPAQSEGEQEEHGQHVGE